MVFLCNMGTYSRIYMQLSYIQYVTSHILTDISERLRVNSSEHVKYIVIGKILVRRKRYHLQKYTQHTPSAQLCCDLSVRNCGNCSSRHIPVLSRAVMFRIQITLGVPHLIFSLRWTILLWRVQSSRWVSQSSQWKPHHPVIQLQFP
jgi:hypothetical protein